MKDKAPMAGSELAHKEELEPSVSRNVDAFFGRLAIPELEPHKERLKEHMKAIIVERNARAEAMQSDGVREAMRIAEELFPMLTCGAICIDGRMGPAVKFGMPGRFGKFLRLPGGDIPEYVKRKDGRGLTLLRGSDFDERLKTLFRNTDEAAEIVDSHLGCAARKQEELGKGKNPVDSGLFADVERKKLIADAMRMQYESSSKHIVPIQFSYDPHRGYGYMGMERLLGKLPSGGFKDEHDVETFIHDSARKGEVISTKLLVEEEPFKDVFAKHAPEVFGLQGEYAASMRDFWRAIKAMHAILIPELEKRLGAVFKDLEPRELRERAMILLVNGFSGYMNNRNEFPYGEHNEEIVMATEREHGPFKAMSFPVFSNDLNSVAKNTMFASGIVRANREAGRTSGNPEDPVPVIVQEIIRDQLPEDVWADAQKVDFSRIAEMEWWKDGAGDEVQFRNAVAEAYPSLPVAIAAAVNQLRKKMAALYDPSRESARHILDGTLAVLPTITDGNRKTRLVIPFEISGY